MKVEPFGPLDPSLYREIVRRALAEDMRWGDVTTDAVVSSDQRAIGEVVIKSAGVLAGVDVALEAFRQLDPHAEVAQLREDGDRCEAGETVVRVTGFASALLTAERTALNFLQRMSGTATLTRRFVDATRGRATILDTRKTTPTLRVLQKYAVRAGGGVNHRLALDDGLLVKDNHIRLVGSIRVAIDRVRQADHAMPVEVEAQSLDEAAAAAEAGVDIILLDNLSTSAVRDAVQLVAGRAKVEVSGGVTLDRVAELATTGVEFISVGALTHSAPAVDFSFEMRPIDTVDAPPSDSDAT